MFAIHYQLKSGEAPNIVIYDDRLYTNVRKVYELAYLPECERAGAKALKYSTFVAAVLSVKDEAFYTRPLSSMFYITIKKRAIL